MNSSRLFPVPFRSHSLPISVHLQKEVEKYWGKSPVRPLACVGGRWKSSVAPACFSQHTVPQRLWPVREREGVPHSPHLFSEDAEWKAIALSLSIQEYRTVSFIYILDYVFSFLLIIFPLLKEQIKKNTSQLNVILCERLKIKNEQVNLNNKPNNKQILWMLYTTVYFFNRQKGKIYLGFKCFSKKELW